MHVLIPDLSTEPARTLADTLGAGGHEVHSCRSAGRPCAVLRGEACPLDVVPVDVAVDVGSAVDDPLGHGELCAVRRRVPLVLVSEDGTHPLTPWAAARVTMEDAPEAVERVAKEPMAEHSATARRVLLDELRRLRLPSENAGAEVRRADGGLRMDIWVSADLPDGEADRIAVHISQHVRRHDPWARFLDVAVHR